jgi:RsiW-degrading membrane proteinase PrsW (M82 family)
MGSRRDPIERAAETGRDLQEVSTWEPRTRLDRVVTRLHGGIRPFARGLLVLTGVALLLGLLAGGLSQVLFDPVLSVLVVLSVVPALLLATYVYRADVTTGEPLELLVPTFVLGVLFANFAAVGNAVGGALVGVSGVAEAVGLGGVVFFYLVVGPVEEAVKLLAVRLYAYRSSRFDAVVDGAVYGAVAGLGFATIENALYITGVAGPTASPTVIAAARALAGPGHVVYSGIAGYYLGLAKFNREYAGPLVIKGLVIAAFVHGTYNVTVGVVPGAVAGATDLSVDFAAFAYIVGFVGVTGLFLYRKVRRYRHHYHAVDAGGIDADTDPARTEFDG